MNDGAIIVTGAAGALGNRIASSFLNDGQTVAGIDRQAKPESLSRPDGDIAWFEADLGDAAAIEMVLDDIQDRLGPIGLLVNAVGLIHSELSVRLDKGLLKPHDPGAWDKVIAANLTAPFLMASATAARMARTGGGVIVNFSSVSARGTAGQAAYAAAKAGLEAATRVMAQEFGPLGVRVNAIAPGFIDVPTTHDGISKDRMAEIISATPAGRLGTVDEVIEAVRFLWANGFVNGMVLGLDGGFTG